MPRKSQSFPPTPLHLDRSAVKMILHGHQKDCWTGATISSLRLLVRADCGAVAWLLQLLELLPAESTARPTDPSPRQVPLPALSSGLRNIGDSKIRGRTEDLEGIKAVNTGCHYH